MKLMRLSSVKAALGRTRGLMLTEVLIGVGITALIGSALVGSIYQMNTIASRTPAYLNTEEGLRISMQWLARDLRRARTTDLTDGAPPVSCAAVSPNPCLTLTWSDEYQGASTSHTASYALEGTEWRRTYNGTTHTVARNITAVGVSLQGRLVQVTLTASSAVWPSVTNQFTHHFYIRPL